MSKAQVKQLIIIAVVAAGVIYAYNKVAVVNRALGGQAGA